ncbi:MAG: hypothetical protein ACK53L_23555 [Pirellulaceae bacterium]
MVDGEARRIFGPTRTPSSRRLEVARLGLRRHRKLNRGESPAPARERETLPLRGSPKSSLDEAVPLRLFPHLPGQRPARVQGRCV